MVQTEVYAYIGLYSHNIRSDVLRSPRVVYKYHLPSAHSVPVRGLNNFSSFVLRFSLVILVEKTQRTGAIWWTRGAAWRKRSARPRKCFGAPSTGRPTTGKKSTPWSIPNKNTGNWSMFCATFSLTRNAWFCLICAIITYNAFDRVHAARLTTNNDNVEWIDVFIILNFNRRVHNINGHRKKNIKMSIFSR